MKIQNKEGKAINNKAIYWDCIQKTWPAAFMQGAVSILGSGIWIQLSAIVGDFADAVFEGNVEYIRNNFWIMVTGIVCYILLEPLTQLLQDYICIRCTTRHDKYIYSLFLKKQFQATRDIGEGELQARLENDVVVFRNNLIVFLAEMIAVPVTLLYLLSVTMLISPLYTGCVIALTMLKLSIPALTSKIKARLAAGESEYQAKIRAILTEFFCSPQAVKLYSLEKFLVEYIKNEFDRFYHDTKKKEIRLNGLCDMISATLGALITILIFLTGAVMVSKGQITMGDVAAMMLFLSVYYEMAERISGMIQGWARTVRFAHRLDYFYQGQEKEGTYGIGQLESIDAENLYFAYEEAGEEVLRNLCFHVKRGDKAVVWGENGSGKSTLIKLLLQFYSNYQGKLQVNGQELSEISGKEWRKHVSISFQDPLLFDGTVRENVMLADPGAPGERVTEVLRSTGLTAIADKSVKGLQGTLSGGEMQRISLARAILKKSDLLILDEPTNHLDENGIEWLKKYLKESTQTVMIITHDKKLLDCGNIYIELG